MDAGKKRKQERKGALWVLLHGRATLQERPSAKGGLLLSQFPKEAQDELWGSTCPPPKIALKVVRVRGGCGRLRGSRHDGVGEHIYGSQTSLDSQKPKATALEYRDVLSCMYLLRGLLHKETQEVQLFPQALLPS